MERNEKIHMTILALEAYWRNHPELRLGQIMSIISKNEINNNDSFYLDDEKIYTYLLNNLKNEDD